ncbi:ABC transporter substrate-binding protein [Methylogaea oryzae]|uniref:ABC transporter substrate-binding protein n=1 Tax=Methylogaea oryzae TaxID=1295382 RepID=UPI0006D28177|nr:ABC transporter substrate-binding protein [Methylogaea oryzae]
MLVARGKGVDAVVVANSAVEELALVARGELAELSRKVPAAEAVARLAENRSAAVKIATQPPGSVPDVVLRHWIKKVTAVDSAKVELVSQGIEKTQQALLAGVIDAAWCANRPSPSSPKPIPKRRCWPSAARCSRANRARW